MIGCQLGWWGMAVQVDACVPFTQSSADCSHMRVCEGGSGVCAVQLLLSWAMCLALRVV